MHQKIVSIILSLFLWAGLTGPSLPSMEHAYAGQEVLLPSTDFSGYFTENKGQWDPAILWAGKTAEGQVAVTRKGMVVQQFSTSKVSSAPMPLSMMNTFYPSIKSSIKVEQEWIPFDLSAEARILAELPLGHVHHYFTGNDPSRWATHCRNFAQLRIQDPLQEKDLLLHFDDQKLMSSMARPTHTTEAEEPSDIHYVMEYSLLIGGSNMDAGTMKLDSQGHPVIVGNTSSADFMLDDPEEEREEFKGETMIFAMKIAPAGQIEFITFVGGSEMDAMIDFHLSDEDHIVMSGMTMSRDFPEVNAFDDMGMFFDVGSFVAVLSSNGDELLNSSFFVAPGSFMTGITSQCLDQEGHLLFSSVVSGTDGFEHDHAMVEETDDFMLSMTALYIIEVDLEAFAITRRILADYGMHMILNMEVNQNNDLFISGLSMNMDGLMMEDMVSLFARVVDSSRESYTASFHLNDKGAHVISAVQWKDPTTLVGIGYEMPDISSLIQDPGPTPTMEEDLFSMESYLFVYELEEESLQTYTIGSEEDAYMINKVFLHEDELWLTGSIFSDEYDIPLPFIEPCEDEEDYIQAVLLKLNSETMEIQSSLVLGGTGNVGAIDIAFGSEDSIFISGISSKDILRGFIDPVLTEMMMIQADAFLVKLVPGVADENPPQITLDLPPLSYVHEQEIEISGKVVDQESGVSRVTLNDEPVILDREGYFNLTLTLEEGSNLFELKAWDLHQNQASKNFEIIFDPHEPIIEHISPAKDRVTTREAVSLQFRVSSEISPIEKVSVAVNGEIRHETGEACPDEGYIFTIELERGENVVLITALTMAGLQSELEYSLWRGISKVIELQIGNQQALIITDGEREAFELDVPPMIIESRTFVPVRFIAEGLGAEVSWDASDSSITIIFEGKRLVLWIGLDYAMLIQEIEGQRITQTLEMDVAPLIMNARTLVPLRFIAEAFGAEVEWNPATQEIRIIMTVLP